MIRPATAADIPELARLGKAWHAASHWPEFVPYDEGDLALTLGAILSSDDAFLLVSEKDGLCGAICVQFVRMYFNSRAKFANEFFWFSNDPRLGLKLLREAERVAFERGAACFILGNQTNDERIAGIYTRLGYRPFSGNFVKGR